MAKGLLGLLRSSGGFISGEKIGEELGVSRTAVWKEINKLRKRGYNIESVTNKGYRLLETEDIINEEEIKLGLKTKIIGKEIKYFDEVSSTNDEAKKCAQIGCDEGTVIIAEKQTFGKGRLGRQWESPSGDGIWMSIILKPDIYPAQASKITLVAGLSVCECIRNITGLPAMIKWPNDVLINGRKICGILTEMNAEIEKVNFMVLGIGINVNMEEFPESIKDKATSLRIESGRRYMRKDIMQEALESFESNYTDFIIDNRFNEFIDIYKKHCTTIGKSVEVLSKNPFCGTAVDINNDGELIIKTSSDKFETVFSGEVSIRDKRVGG